MPYETESGGSKASLACIEGPTPAWIPRRLTAVATAPLRTHVYPILTLQQPSTRCLPYQPPNRTLGGSRQSLGAAFSRLSLVCHSRRFCEWAYVPTAYHQLILTFLSLSRRELACESPTGISLNDFYRYGEAASPSQRLHNRKFLYHELPIRIAQRVVELQSLPHGLSEKPPIRDLAKMYSGYVQTLMNAERPNQPTLAEDDRFTGMLGSIFLGTIITIYGRITLDSTPSS